MFSDENKATKLLIDLLKPHYNQESEIAFEIKVLTALHFYGHGSYQKSIGSNYLLALSQPSVSRVVKLVTTLIVENLSGYIRFPKDRVEIDKIKNG